MIRLVIDKEAYAPAGSPPSWEDFQPNSADKAEGEKRDREPAISVWDDSLTTVAQAVAFRATEKPLRPFWVVVRDVTSIDPDRIRAFADPIEGDGGDGHCGVEGLLRQPKEERRNWKAMLDRVAEKCHRARPANQIASQPPTAQAAGQTATSTPSDTAEAPEETR